jgi:hypothetical protein
VTLTEGSFMNASYCRQEHRSSQTGFVPILYESPALEVFQDFNIFVKSVNYGTPKTCGSNFMPGSQRLLSVPHVSRASTQNADVMVRKREEGERRHTLHVAWQAVLPRFALALAYELASAFVTG